MAFTSAVITRLSPTHILERGDKRELICFALTVTSAAGASGDLTLSTELTSTYGANESERLMQKVRGSHLYWVKYVASGAPDAPTTEAAITVDDQDGVLIFNQTVTTAATSEGWAGEVTIAGVDYLSAPLTDAIIAMGTLANTKKAIVYFWFLK